MWLESTDSTNNEAARRIDSLDNMSVVSALSQNSGRGQRGNTWLSEPGANLTFSIVLKYSAATHEVSQSLPPLEAKHQLAISVITALSVIELLETYRISARIKWPNDIYVGEKKICGILIEHSIKGIMLSHSIVGIGLNINQRNFDVSLPNPTSIVLCRDELGRVEPTDCLERFMDIYKRYLPLLSEGRDISRIYNQLISKLRPGSPIEEINLALQR